eukprot:85146-Pelagomonas_calceolata.AAC.2
MIELLASVVAVCMVSRLTCHGVHSAGEQYNKKQHECGVLCTSILGLEEKRGSFQLSSTAALHP